MNTSGDLARPKQAASAWLIRIMRFAGTCKQADRIIGKFNTAGRMRIHQDHLQLTDEGKAFADGIAADLFV